MLSHLSNPGLNDETKPKGYRTEEVLDQFLCNPRCWRVREDQVEVVQSLASKDLKELH